MSEIHDQSLLYKLVRRYTLFSFKRFYNQYIVLNQENIPLSGPVIYAPNHLNALMDALAVISVIPKEQPIVFLARSDMFKNKTAAKLLRFTKIMPAFRMRDGIDQLGKNNEIFEQCVKILEHNNALGIMPEGNQGEQRKLRPLVKGIFRIAFAAQQKMNTGQGVKIVPIGIDLSDLVKSREHIIINIGKPIEVADYMSKYVENPVIATNELRDKLRSELELLTVNIDSDKYYDCFETAIEVATNKVTKKLKLKPTTQNSFLVRQKIAQKLVKEEKQEPLEIERLVSLCVEYKKKLSKLKISDNQLAKKPTSRPQQLILGGLLFVTIPLFTVGFLFNFLPYYSPIFVRKYILKAEYKGFYNSLHFGVGAILAPLFYALQTLLVGYLTQWQWWFILASIPLQLLTKKPTLKWLNQAQMLTKQWRIRTQTNRKSRTLELTKQLRKKIVGTVISLLE